jgi:hypothetical protein
MAQRAPAITLRGWTVATLHRFATLPGYPRSASSPLARPGLTFTQSGDRPDRYGLSRRSRGKVILSDSLCTEMVQGRELPPLPSMTIAARVKTV